MDNNRDFEQDSTPAGPTRPSGSRRPAAGIRATGRITTVRRDEVSNSSAKDPGDVGTTQDGEAGNDDGRRPRPEG